MEIKAKVKNLRISPRKARLVVDLVRGLEVDKALGQLQFMNKRAAKPIMKLVKSAIANATNNYGLEESNLFIQTVKVDEGSTLKRWLPRARGRATPLRKRSSHISLVLGELVDSGDKTAKKQKIDAPVKIDAKVSETKTDTQAGKGAKSKGVNNSKNIKSKGTSEKKSAGMFRRKSG